MTEDEGIKWDGTCLYCGRYLPRSRSYRYYCTRSHKSKARVKRAEARKSQTDALGGLCPRSKDTLAFTTEQTARMAATDFQRKYGTILIVAYKCSCGLWHIGHEESKWKLTNSRRAERSS